MAKTLEDKIYDLIDIFETDRAKEHHWDKALEIMDGEGVWHEINTWRLREAVRWNIRVCSRCDTGLRNYERHPQPCDI